MSNRSKKTETSNPLSDIGAAIILIPCLIVEGLFGLFSS